MAIRQGYRVQIDVNPSPVAIQPGTQIGYLGVGDAAFGDHHNIAEAHVLGDIELQILADTHAFRCRRVSQAQLHGCSVQKHDLDWRCVDNGRFWRRRLRTGR